MQADIYARQSVLHEEGIGRQVELASAMVSRRGWTVAQVFRDNATSATKARAAGSAWAQMLASPAEVVVAVDLDRLLRSQRDLLTLIDSGKKVVTVDGEIDLSTADGEFRATLLAALARFEVKKKSERQVRANTHRAQNGLWVGGRRPFGFEPDGHTTREDEAQLIRDAYTATLAGVPLGAIAKDWTDRGYISPQGSTWERTGLRKVLMNPRHMGMVRYKGEIVGPAQWPATVDEETFRATEALLSAPGRRTTISRKDGHLLTGVAICGVCGAGAHAGGNARRGIPGYRCSGALGHFSRRAEPIEAFVEALVVARLARPDARDLLRPDQPDTGAMRQRAVVLRGRLDALAVEFADGVLTSSQLRAATERLRSELAKIEDALTDAGRVDVLAGLVGAEDVQAAWDALTMARKREVIRTIMLIRLMPVGRGVRTFRPESVEIAWAE